ANAVTAWHANALYCFAGWSAGPLHRKITAPEGPWQPLPTTNPPPQASEGSRLSSLRGGVNRTASYLSFLAEGNELYTCALAAQTCPTWGHVSTTGAKPTSHNGVYARGESRNKLGGWGGSHRDRPRRIHTPRTWPPTFPCTIGCASACSSWPPAMGRKYGGMTMRRSGRRRVCPPRPRISKSQTI